MYPLYAFNQSLNRNEENNMLIKCNFSTEEKDIFRIVDITCRQSSINIQCNKYSLLTCVYMCVCFA